MGTPKSRAQVPTLAALGVEQAQAIGPVRVRRMTPEERAGFEARAAERERLSRTGVFACKRNRGD